MIQLSLEAKKIIARHIPSNYDCWGLRSELERYLGQSPQKYGDVFEEEFARIRAKVFQVFSEYDLDWSVAGRSLPYWHEIEDFYRQEERKDAWYRHVRIVNFVKAYGPFRLKDQIKQVEEAYQESVLAKVVAIIPDEVNGYLISDRLKRVIAEYRILYQGAEHEEFLIFDLGDEEFLGLDVNHNGRDLVYLNDLCPIRKLFSDPWERVYLDPDWSDLWKELPNWERYVDFYVFKYPFDDKSIMSSAMFGKVPIQQIKSQLKADHQKWLDGWIEKLLPLIPDEIEF
jgi:hypothetical protein